MYKCWIIIYEILVGLTIKYAVYVNIGLELFEQRNKQD